MDKETTVSSKASALPNHVLVIEDDPILVMAIEDSLREAGVTRIEFSPTTDGALEAMKHAQPDAIVLDIHLADRADGWAIAELVRDLGPDHPRIIFSTGAPEDIPDHIAVLGTVLEKPYRPESLIDLLRTPKRRGIVDRLRGALR